MSVRHAVTIAFSTAISFFAVACAPTKFSECEEIIRISVRVTEQTKELCPDCQTENFQEALQVADTMEKAAEEMNTISITDEKLKDYQVSFVEIYRGMSQATRNFIAALDQKDLQAAKEAKEKLQIVGNKEQQTVNGINNYCSSEE